MGERKKGGSLAEAGGASDGPFDALLDGILRWRRPGKTLLVGLVGLPGAGKSTLASRLVEGLGPLRADTVSLDDFYLPKEERLRRGFALRGPPGTHDERLLSEFVAQVASQPRVLSLPVFDRGREQRCENRLREGPLDVLVFEGFLVGISAPGYEPLRRALDRLVYVDIDAVAALASRRKREAKNIAAGQPGMTDDQVSAFWRDALWPQVERFVLPLRERADAIVSLENDHTLQAVRFAGED